MYDCKEISQCSSANGSGWLRSKKDAPFVFCRVYIGSDREKKPRQKRKSLKPKMFIIHSLFFDSCQTQFIFGVWRLYTVCINREKNSFKIIETQGKVREALYKLQICFDTSLFLIIKCLTGILRWVLDLWYMKFLFSL